MKKSLLVLVGAAAAAGLAVSPVAAQQKGKAPKAYVGPAAHVACAKLGGDKRDACIRNLPTQVFATVKSPAPVKAAAAAAAPAAAAKAAPAKAAPAPKAYVGPAAHVACSKLGGDKRDACIRKLPTQVFSTVKNVAVAKAAAAPAAAVAAKAAPAPKGYVGPAAHLACAKLPGDKRDSCIRNLPVVKGPGVATVSASSKK